MTAGAALLVVVNAETALLVVETAETALLVAAAPTAAFWSGGF